MKEKPAKNSGESQLELKIGAFVLLGVLLCAGVIFLLGKEKHMFEENVTLRTQFKDVGGLRDGAPVRLSGVNVGRVLRVAFEKNLKDAKIKVEFEVTRGALERIRKDSIVRIGGEGLLGDKIIQVSLGSPDVQGIPPGGFVQSEEGMDLNQVAEKAAQVMDKLKVVADNAASLLAGVGDEKTITKIQGSVASLRSILGAIERGPSLAHALFYEQWSEDMFAGVMERVNQLLNSTNASVKRVEKLLAATNEEGLQLINHASIAAKNFAKTAQDLNQSKLLANLEKATGDLAAVTATVRSGRGTVGGMIVDPTAYHQLLTILGGVERSKILRAIVRYAVGKNDANSPQVGLQSGGP